MNLKLMKEIVYNVIDAVYGSTGVAVASQRKLMLQKILFVFYASKLLNFKWIFVNDYLIITCRNLQTRLYE